MGRVSRRHFLPVHQHFDWADAAPAILHRHLKFSRSYGRRLVLDSWKKIDQVKIGNIRQLVAADHFRQKTGHVKSLFELVEADDVGVDNPVETVHSVGIGGIIATGRVNHRPRAVL